MQTKSEVLLKQRASAEEKLKNAQNRMISLGDVPDKDTVEETRCYLQEVNTLIDNAVRKNKEYHRSIIKAEEELDELIMLESRYQTLFAQYTADIERLDTIAQGQKSLFAYPDYSVCPVCGGELPQRQEVSYIEAAKAELKKTAGLMKDLTKAIDEINVQIDNKKKSVKEITDKRNVCSQEIDTTLKPMKIGLDHALKKYEESASLKREIQLLTDLIRDYDNDLNAIKGEKSKGKENKTVKYRPFEHFRKEDIDELTNVAVRIMNECGLPDAEEATFDIKGGDIKIKGEDKSAFHGQGFSSLINSIVYIAFHEFCCMHARFDPGLLIIDTPLLGLVDKMKKDGPSEIPVLFYRYLAKSEQMNQVIILDNMEELPDFLYHHENVNVQDFSEYGRKGFLLDFSVAYNE